MISDIEKIEFENHMVGLFDSRFWLLNKFHSKINAVFIISAIRASI